MNEYKTIGLIYENKVLNELAFGVGPNAQPITREQLLDKIAIAETSGAVPISITVVSIPGNQVRQKNNPFYPIYKVSQINGILGAEYGTSVNRQREREGLATDFKAKQGWGKHLSRAIIEGPNGISIQIQPTDTGHKRESVYVGTQGGSFIVLDRAEWEPLVPKYNRPAAAQIQGVTKDVLVIKPLVKNIVGATVQGHEYTITDLDITQKTVLDISGIR